MSRRTDRRDRTAELKLVAQALAQHHNRATEHIVDVESWLEANKHRQLGSVLYVVWDRADAAVLTYARPELEVRVAAAVVGWARRRAQDAAHPADIPRPRPDPPDASI
ncbi:hypothetical protein INP57_01570 [Saccharopolyspora sp. HNM0986]|uniref:hypothetical protein n=1 Tax=Saccharopolyspora galaxeae TaxID=2781241 RepID=UPI00190ABA97|nr:hypothetical protein [Saccharopolyspora sp. HNM0986]MBK0865492.1 hypothetical protein [Saccharopolyspora sp. HNM0986]